MPNDTGTLSSSQGIESWKVTAPGGGRELKLRLRTQPGFRSCDIRVKTMPSENSGDRKRRQRLLSLGIKS